MKIPFYIEVGAAIFIGFGLYKLAPILAVIYVALVVLRILVDLFSDQ